MDRIDAKENKQPEKTGTILWGGYLLEYGHGRNERKINKMVNTLH